MYIVAQKSNLSLWYSANETYNLIIVFQPILHY